MRVGFVSLTAVLLGSACQLILQPLEPRQAQALTVTPNRLEVFWLLDKSGSMAARDVCDADGGCVTRKEAITRGLSDMVARLPAATHSAIVFPAGSESCGGPTSVETDIGADGVSNLYASLLVGGGTPTASALALLAARSPPGQTTSIAVLVTDGIPNCNPSNPNNVCTSVTPETVAACRCTASQCNSPANCSTGCVDELGTVEAGRALGEAGYELMVLAVGADLARVASPFSSMRIDLQPSCASPEDCDGRACTNGLCADRVFRVADLTTFASPGRRLERAMTEHERCVWWLDRQLLPGQLSPAIGGQSVLSTQWTLEGSGARQHVRFSGAACEALLGSSTLVPTAQGLVLE